MENAFVTGKDNPCQQILYNMVKQIYIDLRGKYLTSIPSQKMSTLQRFTLSKKKSLKSPPVLTLQSPLSMSFIRSFDGTVKSWWLFFI